MPNHTGRVWRKGGYVWPGRRVTLRSCLALDQAINQLKSSGDVLQARALARLLFEQGVCRVVGESAGTLTLKRRASKYDFSVPAKAVKTVKSAKQEEA
jgi:predicted amidophosphoribosyltransferase